MEDMTRLGKENKLSSLEKPKDIYLSSDAFSIENDQLTPTFKLKRNVAQKAYQEQLDAMYEKL
jgi:long-chain acyl-CoA synthetase